VGFDAWYVWCQVEDPVNVQIKLYRPSDGVYSKPVDFTLTPLVNSGRASLWNMRRPSLKKGNYTTFSQILAADSAVLAQAASLPEPASTAPAKAQLGQDVPVVDLTATEQVDVPVDSPDGPMESRMPQVVVTSGLTIGPVPGAQDAATVTVHHDVHEADYATVHKWPKLSPPADPNGNAVGANNNNEGEEGCQSLSDLIEQVGAELSEFYEGAKLHNQTEFNLSPMTDITMADLPMNDLADIYDDASYSSLQLAMKNPVSVPVDDPVSLVDSYDNSLALAIASKGPPPLPPLLIAAKRESPEKGPPPLPPKRARRAQPEAPSRSLPPTPSGGKSPKSGKQTFFSRLFRKSPSKSKKDTVSLRAPSLSRDNSVRRAATPTGGSMGNLARFRDGEDSIFISLRPTEDETLAVVTSADPNDNDAAPPSILYADCEQLDLYTDMAPRATVPELDELSSYYSPVEGGRVLMPDRAKLTLNMKGV